MYKRQDYVRETIPHLCHWFTVNDLMFLKRGGRVDAATALVGTVLQIKPVMHTDSEGRLIPMSKARGTKAALKALVDKVEELGVEPDKNQPLFICHANCPDSVAYVKELLEERFGVKITDEKLRESIHILNQERSQMAQLYELGKLDPPAATGMQMRSVLTAEYFMLDKKNKLEKTERMLKLMREQWEAGEWPYKPDQHPLRILVSGAGIDGVVDKTLGVIEELGAAIVCYEGLSLIHI